MKTRIGVSQDILFQEQKDFCIMKAAKTLSPFKSRKANEAFYPFVIVASALITLAHFQTSAMKMKQTETAFPC